MKINRLYFYGLNGVFMRGFLLPYNPYQCPMSFSNGLRDDKNNHLIMNKLDIGQK
ncbi:MAG: hypothetical protein MUE85_07810 [Microscillaceae bacterium]|nr:hypothetical protein [Microscillaceae bacterium]